MDTQHEAENIARLRGLLAHLVQAAEEAKAHMDRALTPAHWEGDEWIDAETEDDRAYIVTDELIAALVAACLSICDGEPMTPAQFANYVRVMASAHESAGPRVSPTALAVLDFVARCEQGDAEQGRAAAQCERIQWMMEMPQEKYLAALERTTPDGEPRIVWSIHPDDWDFEKGRPTHGRNGNGAG